MAIDFEELYKRYVDDRSDLPPYLYGSAEIGEQDLFERIGAEFDEMQSGGQSLEAYADPDRPDIVLEIFSINEAKHLYEELEQRLK